MQALIGNTILLRELRPADAAMNADYYRRNRDFHQPWFPRFAPSYYTEEFWQELLGMPPQSSFERNSFRFGIFEGERIVGHVNLSGIERGFFRNARLGYSMDEHFNGKGVMTAAVGHVVHFAFRELQLHRVEANIMPRNIPSRKVLEKNGFTKIGHSPKYLYLNGCWEDHDMYMKLDEDW